MCGKGKWVEKGMGENLFGIMKCELVYRENFECGEGFIKGLDKYIEYYKNKRMKGGLNGKSGVE